MKRIPRWLLGGIFFLMLSVSSSVFAIAVNDAIKTTTDGINVRATASTSGTIITTKPLGSVGTVNTGPTVANGFTWWNIIWDTGSQGWSADSNMVLNTPTAKPFTNGSGIQVVTGNTNTRASASTTGTLLANKSIGATGVIAGGPYFANGYAWWLINWTGGPQGWTVQDYLIAYTFPTITSVTASCSPSTISVNQTTQCTGVISGTGNYSNLGFWSVVSGGGSISGSGVYTAPATATTATIRATSAADASKYGNTNVTVTAAAPTVSGVTVTCTPTSVQVNQTAQCAATVSGTGSYSSAVNWSLTAGGGSVNASGLYTSPSTLPSPATASIRATSVQDGTKFGAASVTTTTPSGFVQSSPDVFLDSSGSGWFLENWTGVTSNPTSPAAYHGDNSVEVKTTTQWGRVQFTSWANYRFNTAGYDSISFWVNVGQSESEVLYVGLLNSSYQAIQYVNILNPLYVEGGTLNSYQWKLVTIPLSALAGSNTFIYGVEIQSGNPATFNFDDLRFNLYGACVQ